MTTTMMRLCRNCAWILRCAPLTGGLSNTIIVVSSPQRQRVSQPPINPPVMLLLSCSETTPHGRQPTDVEAIPGYLI